MRTQSAQSSTIRTLEIPINVEPRRSMKRTLLAAPIALAFAFALAREQMPHLSNL